MKKIVFKILSRLKLLPYLNISAHSKGIYIPVMGGIGYSNFYGTEIWMSQLLEQLLKHTNGIFIDVGVNLGQTLIKLRLLNRDIEYVGFEPNPVCIYYAEKLISRNNFQNCIIIPAGASNTTEILTLKIFGDEADPMASVIDDFKDQARKERAVLVIDPILVQKVTDKEIGILKIDVEGAELYVLEGFYNLIKKDRPFITMEILPARNETTEYSGRAQRQERITEYLKELDYAMLRIMKTPDDKLGELALITEIGKQTDYNLSDYLFVPSEKLVHIKNDL